MASFAVSIEESPRVVVDALLEGIVDCACLIECETGRIVHANAKMREIFGPNLSAPCYKTIHGLDAACTTCPFNGYLPMDAVLQGPPFVMESYLKNKQAWYTVRFSFFKWWNGRPVSLVVLVPRVEASQREQELEELAFSDEKTGVANNRWYEREGPVLLEQTERKGRQLAVIALKVEGLHNINSVQGYAQGDAVLRSIAGTIARCLPKKALFARRRGNDFSILYPFAAEKREDICELMARLEQELASTATRDAKCFWYRLCFGISLFPEHGRTFEGLNRKARQAISTCNTGTRQFSYALYNGTLMSDLRRRETLKLELASAVRNRQLHLLFQPQHEVRSSRVVGAEALIRWNHPVYGQIGANEFIPLAEESLLIPAIDEWVIDEACRQWRELFDAGCPIVPFSVNISPQKFYQPDLVDTLQAAMQRHMLMPGMLEIELTERTALQDMDKAIEVMGHIRNNGIRIAMDDFGTGYSSLNYLRALPFDVIKLDQTFVMDTSDRGKAVLKTIVSLAKAYDSLVIFEGVETEVQYHFACQIGCDLVQGFYTGRPMTPENLALLLSRQNSGKIGDNQIKQALNHSAGRLFR